MLVDLTHPAVTKEAFDLIVKRMSDRAAVRFSMTCQRAEAAVSKFRRPAVNIYEAYKRKEVDLMEKHFWITCLPWRIAKRRADFCDTMRRKLAIEMYRSGKTDDRVRQWSWFADRYTLLLDHAMNILVLSSEMFVDIAQLQIQLYGCE